ncbi:MAG: hypothetical protein AAF197_13180 [Pseudomonadota bacterium]
MKKTKKTWLILLVVVSTLTAAFGAMALQGKISLNSPVTFPVDI